MSEIEKVNEIVNSELWFDFEIKSFDSYKLVIVGGIDIYANWIIELVFSDVVFVSLRNDWQRNDKIGLLEIIPIEMEKEVRRTQLIGKDYTIYGLNHDELKADRSNQMIVAAKKLEYRLNGEAHSVREL